jgi:hypothetical protein
MWKEGSTMIEELALVFGSHVVAAEDIYPAALDYRLHTIETRPAGRAVVAIVYDGEQEVRRLYGKDYHQALAHAKAWIDEQDELMS